jgi:hypothetical protein
MLGCQVRLGSGGDYVAQFGNELMYGSSLADIRKKIEARWNKSIGKSYEVSFVDVNGDYIVETFIPRLVKVRSLVKRVENVVGQLSFEF